MNETSLFNSSEELGFGSINVSDIAFMSLLCDLMLIESGSRNLFHYPVIK